MIIEDFSRPDTEINGLIATDILTRGFDVTDVMIGVSARPFSKSFSSHVQQMGRVMRPHDGKEYGVWLDHSGNYLRFKDDWDRVFDYGVDSLDGGLEEKAKKEPTDKEKVEAKCPSCGALWIWKSDECGECGHVKKKIAQIQVLDGELQELAVANSKLKIDNRQFFQELMHYATSRGYKEGWAAHKYKEKFGVFPKNIPKETKPPSPQTLSWIKSRMIAYSKSKQRIAA
jgi:superfamily II DNA or RNA helicase